MRIGILFGGRSFEHDISIISANIIYHALKEKYEVCLMYIDRNGNLCNPKKIDILEIASGKKYKSFSFCKCGIRTPKYRKIDTIISTMHGLNGEDGLASVIANLYDIPYVGSNHISSGLLLDKHFTYALLRDLDIKTIDTKSYINNIVFDEPKFPLIIKPARLGSSIGISKVLDNNQMIESLTDALRFDNKIVVQPFIENFKEYNQAAYLYKGEVVVSNVEEVFKSEDILSFDDKYISSKVKKNHAFIMDDELISKISTITKKIYTNFELSGIVRVDYMVVGDEVIVNEINTTPGSLAYYLFNEEILSLLEKQIHTALLNFQNRKETTFVSSVLYQKYNYKK